MEICFLQIGDVLESGPPRNNRSNSKNRQAHSGVDDSGDDSSASTQPPRAASPASSSYSDAPRPRRFRKRNRIMKTRVSNTGGSSATLVVTSNGPTNGTRRPRLQSVDQVYLGNSNNNPLSPRTRSTTKQEVDEEVSFV